MIFSLVIVFFSYCKIHTSKVLIINSYDLFDKKKNNKKMKVNQNPMKVSPKILFRDFRNS